jgi:hypothetical protein
MYLEELPGNLFDDLFGRIHLIKEKYRSSLFRIDENQEMNNNSMQEEIKISNKISKYKNSHS